MARPLAQRHAETAVAPLQTGALPVDALLRHEVVSTTTSMEAGSPDICASLVAFASTSHAGGAAGALLAAGGDRIVPGGEQTTDDT